MLSRLGPLCFLYLVIASGPAIAECTSPGFNPGKDFCNN